MFTKFNKQSDFVGRVGDVVIKNQEIHFLISDAVNLIYTEFGAACSSQFIFDLTACVDSLFDFEWVDNHLVSEDLSASIFDATSIETLQFDLFGMDEQTRDINMKLQAGEYLFEKAHKTPEAPVIAEFSGTVFDLHINDGFVFNCLRSFVDEFERKFGVVVNSEFVHDFFDLFEHYKDIIWPDGITHDLRESLAASSTVKDLSFSVIGRKDLHVLNSINDKLKNSLYDLKYLDVYYDVRKNLAKFLEQPFDLSNPPSEVIEVYPYKGTDDINQILVIYSGDFFECKELMDYLNEENINRSELFQSNSNDHGRH